MKKLGYLLITVGFLGGALAATMDKEHVRWDFFLAGLAAGAVGVGLVRFGERRHSRGEGKLVSDIEAVEASLERIVRNMTELNAQKSSINTYDVRHRIDELFIDDLDAFVQARESIAHTHGLNAYAEVMSTFAAGERYLNRVWSASADGYIDEVNAYLDNALAQFVESLDKMRQLKAGSAPQV
ncbi:MAG: hypothetical protein ABIF19_18535 [Planctomycetota bacterium]